MLKPSPFLSVIVPVYNGHAFLHRCLDAIFASDFSSLEVILVDDCSTDDSAEIGRSKGARVVSTVRNSGPAAARNLAAGTAKGEILVFVDADVVVKPTTLGQMAEHFRTRPEIAGVFGSYDDEPLEKNFLSQYKNLQHHFVHQESAAEASTFWSGLGAMRRPVFLAHGGFDCEKFAVPSIEDIDLGVRVRSTGHKILLDREIQAKHLKRWDLLSHLRTEIFCRALPWSRLILQSNGLVNDMNLKKADRISALLVAILLLSVFLTALTPIFALSAMACLIMIAVLNRRILSFFARTRGLGFAAKAYPLHILYFFYSGTTFSLCWIWYSVFKSTLEPGETVKERMPLN